jgi:hypothetical protein
MSADEGIANVPSDRSGKFGIECTMINLWSTYDEKVS